MRRGCLRATRPPSLRRRACPVWPGRQDRRAHAGSRQRLPKHRRLKHRPRRLAPTLCSVSASRPATTALASRSTAWAGSPSRVILLSPTPVHSACYRPPAPPVCALHACARRSWQPGLGFLPCAPVPPAMAKCWMLCRSRKHPTLASFPRRSCLASRQILRAASSVPRAWPM